MIVNQIGCEPERRLILEVLARRRIDRISLVDTLVLE